MQDLVDIINNAKLSSKMGSIIGSKPITIDGLVRIINGYIMHQNDAKTKMSPISKTTITKSEAKPVNTPIESVSGVVSLNEIGEKK